MVFPMETKLKMGEVKNLKHKLGLKNVVWVSCKGEGRKRAEGLGLLWDKEAKTNLISFSQNHIDVRVKDIGENKDWRFT